MDVCRCNERETPSVVKVGGRVKALLIVGGKKAFLIATEYYEHAERKFCLQTKLLLLHNKSFYIGVSNNGGARVGG